MNLLISLKKMFITIFSLITCLLFLISCEHALPEDKKTEVISSIAEIITDNYTSADLETPFLIRMIDIEKLADKNSELSKFIEKYDDIKQYKAYLLDDNKVMIVTDVIFQSVKGYVVSNEELGGVLVVPGSGFDADKLNIQNEIEDNIYTFWAGL